MVGSFTDFITSSHPVVCPILKVTVPNEYSDGAKKKLYNDIKDQIGDYFMPVIVPEDVNLEVVE